MDKIQCYLKTETWEGQEIFDIHLKLHLKIHNIVSASDYSKWKDKTQGAYQKPYAFQITVFI